MLANPKEVKVAPFKAAILTSYSDVFDKSTLTCIYGPDMNISL